MTIRAELDKIHADLDKLWNALAPFSKAAKDRREQKKAIAQYYLKIAKKDLELWEEFTAYYWGHKGNEIVKELWDIDQYLRGKVKKLER